VNAREQDNADIDALAARLAGRPLDDLDTIEWLWDEGKRLVDAGRVGSAALQVNTAHLVARVVLLAGGQGISAHWRPSSIGRETLRPPSSLCL
jgi:hypothetical protein